MIRKSLALLIGALVASVVAMVAFVGGWRLSSEFSRATHQGCFENTSSPASAPSVSQATPEESRDVFAVYWEVWELIHAEFYHEEPLDQKEMTYGSIRGMLQTLGDEYTAFEEPVVAERTREEIRGTFDGIGVLIRIEEGEVVVIHPMRKSPAIQAGIQAGDIIVSVDGENVSELIERLNEGEALEAISQKVRGPRGSTVHLTLRRPPETDTFELEVMRDAVPLISVNAQMINDEVAHIQITDFRNITPGEFEEALNEILPQNPSGLVLDLRNNHGGVLRAAQEILGYFYDGVALYEEDSDGDFQQFETLSDPDDPRVPNIPIVILVNDHTASAAEIVAGALDEERSQTTLMGTESYGKGSVQNVHRLSDGSNVRITIAHWLTPDKNEIHEVGIAPDYVVAHSQEPAYAMPCIGDTIPPEGQEQCNDAQLAWGVWYLTEGRTPPTPEPESVSQP